MAILALIWTVDRVFLFNKGSWLDPGLVRSNSKRPDQMWQAFLEVEMAGIEPASERFNHPDVYKRRQLLFLSVGLQLPKVSTD